MPVTARLSLKFYQTFGDEIANELVDWFNAVDERYRTQLRELNETNFARFDARLEQRLAKLRSELRSELSQLRTDMAALAERLTMQIATSEQRTHALIVGQTRWLIGLWAAQITIFVGTVLVVLRQQ